MICSVEPRSLEDDLSGSDDLLERFLTALGAGLQRGITEGLLALELDAAILAAVRVNWHGLSPC